MAPMQSCGHRALLGRSDWNIDLDYSLRGNCDLKRIAVALFALALASPMAAQLTPETMKAVPIAAPTQASILLLANQR